MRKAVSVLLLFLNLLFLVACNEKNSRKEYPCGFLGLGKVGDPEEGMGSLVNYINAAYEKEEIFPAAREVISRLPANKLFLYYSKTTDNYQLAYWSGETTWIYDFKTNSYYETKKDMSHEKWFYPSEKTELVKEDIDYINLAIQTNAR